MDGDNSYEIIYHPEEDEYRVYCEICDKFCIERYYKNHLKSQIHKKNVRKKQQLKIFFTSINHIQINMSYYCEVCVK